MRLESKRKKTTKPKDTLIYQVVAHQGSGGGHESETFYDLDQAKKYATLCERWKKVYIKVLKEVERIKVR